MSAWSLCVPGCLLRMLLALWASDGHIRLFLFPFLPPQSILPPRERLCGASVQWGALLGCQENLCSTLPLERENVHAERKNSTWWYKVSVFLSSKGNPSATGQPHSWRYLLFFMFW